MTSPLRRIVVAVLLSWVGNGMHAEHVVGQGPGLVVVTCESSGPRRLCPAGTMWRGARLVKQLSKAPCVQGESWGFEGRGIWVDKGCRGQFEVGRPGLGAPPVTSVRRLTCGVLTETRAECETGGRAAGVRLVSELSTNRCRQNDSWGYTDAVVWTSRGCRGEFEVVLVSPGGAPDESEPQVISCGTSTGQYASCAASGSIREVRLLRDASGMGRCQPPQSWGHSNSEIWTRNGCRGDFQVLYHRGAGGPVAPPTRHIACGLATGQRVECKTGGYARAVSLVKDFSGRCRLGSTWGNSESIIWTTLGCRGEFEVTYRAGPD